MRQGSPSPPRLAVWLLQRCLRAPHCEFVLGDLQERFREIAEQESPAAARKWFWKNARAAARERYAANDYVAFFFQRGEPVEIFLQDLRYALRGLARNPLFTSVAVLALALGIGANTAVFSIARAVLLSSGPFTEPERIVRVWVTQPQEGKDRGMAASGNFADWERESATLQNVTAYFSWSQNLTGVEVPVRLNAVLATGEFFNLLGTRPLLGRTLVPDDAREGSPNVVVLSHALWARQFGGDPAIVGRSVTLNRAQHTVVGVMPADFNFPSADTDAWLPFVLTPDHRANRAGGFLNVIARLKPGVTTEQAQAEMTREARRQEEAFAEANRGRGLRVVALHTDEVREIRPALGLLGGAAFFVLLLACANVANLLLVRAAQRSHELNLRVALGAGRARLVSQRLTESLVLCVLGGVCGALLSYGLLPVVKSLAPPGLPRIEQVSVSAGVLAFTAAISLAATLLSGLAPAIFGVRRALHGEVALHGRTVAGARQNFRTVLIIGEVAVMVILLAGTGLLARSFAQVVRVPLGFDADSLLTMRVWLPGWKYPSTAQQAAFFRQALERVRGVPGVASASAIQDVPLGQNQMLFPVKIEGRATPAGEAASRAVLRSVGGGYFETMRIPVMRGRSFREIDTENAAPVVVINEAMAAKFWPGQSPLGQRVQYGESRWAEIVGVVGNTKHLGPEAGEEAPAIYQPFAQKGEDMSFLRWQTLVIRTHGRPQDWVAAVRAQLLALDPDQPVYGVATMDELLARALARPRFSLFLMGSLGVLALVLGTVGVYSVLAQITASRAREIGVRMALGARPGDIFRAVLGFGLSRGLMGVAIGVGAGVGLSSYLQSLLFEVSRTDACTFAAVSALALLIAAAASVIPAMRAARVDPVEALRHE